MLKIGITGGIGSGKTTICKVFELIGIPVFYADEAAKQLMVKDRLLIEGIKSAFGKESYFEDATLNRKHISSIVFNDEQALSMLNSLVHPAVFRAFDEWLIDAGTNAPYVMKEAALLFESNSYKMCDETILVVSPEPLRLRRVMDRDNATEEEIRARMDKQFTDEQKQGLADHMIFNDNKCSVIEQVMGLHKIFQHGR
ncbi:MAG: dephospho-CoA kinase [Pedobacter sp.]|nr:MAG: dephospho-CoA kinase [Pedobacter sp.]